MSEVIKIKRKIVLVGDPEVGKTSLLRKFVLDEFSDKYLMTVGTKVTSKKLIYPYTSNGSKIELTLMVWDIMGQHGFSDIIHEAYFFGTQGIIAVCDITRKDTLYDLEWWIQSLSKTVQNIPIVFVGNKSDLMEEAEFKFEELKEFATEYGEPKAFLSSAKTGINVNLTFKILAESILKKRAEEKSSSK